MHRRAGHGVSDAGGSANPQDEQGSGLLHRVLHVASGPSPAASRRTTGSGLAPHTAAHMTRSSSAKTAQMPPKSMGLAVYAALYLTTGTTLAIVGQLVVAQGAAAPNAHVPSLVKYLSSTTLSLLLNGVRSLTGSLTGSTASTAAPRRRMAAERLKWAVG